MELARSIVELLGSIAGLLTWQWVVLILGVSFRAPLWRLIDRVIGVSFGGKKGFSLTAAQLREIGEQRGTTPEPVSRSVKPEKQIEAERFVLRDTGGKVRAILGLSDTESATLSLRDGEGKERAALYATAHGPSAVALFDEKGEPCVMLGAGDLLALVLRGSHGQPAVSLAVDEKGDPSFDGVNSQGLPVWNFQ